MKNILLAQLFFVATLPCFAFSQNASHKVVLLSNDAVMEGQLTSLANGYQIKTTNGVTLTLSLNDVAAICNSFQEIYELKQFAILPNQPEKHLELARWCIKYELFDNAKKEVETAQTMLGNNTVTSMLKRQIETAKSASLLKSRFDEKLPQSSDVENAEANKEETKFVELNGRQLDEIVQRVPQSVVSNYIRYIQSPIISGCTARGCHLSNKTSLKLSRRSLNSPVGRRMTQRNLITMIEWANRDHVETSELLQKSISAHGDLKEPVWAADSRNYLWLKLWVTEVQKQRIDLGITNDRVVADSHVIGSNKLANHVQSDTGQSKEVGAEPVDFVPSVPNGKAGTKRSKVVDPFDPKEFNQKYSGKSK